MFISSNGLCLEDGTHKVNQMLVRRLHLMVPGMLGGTARIASNSHAAAPIPGTWIKIANGVHRTKQGIEDANNSSFQQCLGKVQSCVEAILRSCN